VGFAGYLAYHNSEHFAGPHRRFPVGRGRSHSQLGFATDAIREGGLFGVGVGEGAVKWTLPDAHTDFIIAVAAEEYGLILVFTIIALFATIVVRSFYRLMRERDPFIRLAGAGLVSLIGIAGVHQSWALRCGCCQPRA
jgi:cell division protein FtsW